MPQTFHQRFLDYAVVAFGPRALFTPAVGAAFSMLHPPSGYPREWRQGMGAFGRIYGSRVATHTAEQTARFLTAADGLTPTLYLPTGDNTLSRAETRMALVLGGFAIKNLTREFAPDLVRATRNLHVPFPRIPISGMVDG